MDCFQTVSRLKGKFLNISLLVLPIFHSHSLAGEGKRMSLKVLSWPYQRLPLRDKISFIGCLELICHGTLVLVH